MSSLKENIGLLSLLVTVILAITGYAITYLNNLRLARRKERLDKINAQLNELYGPLYVLTRTGDAVYEALTVKVRNQGRRYADQDAPRSADDVSEWRIWVENVFMPMNQILEKSVIDKTHLILEDDIPDCLLRFMAHNAGYKVVVRKWQLNDFSESTSLINFPNELTTYAEQSYKYLKQRQLHIIGARHIH